MDVILSKGLNQVTVASGSDGVLVYKDECIYCFHTPVSEDGLYVSLNSFLGLCKNHIQLHFSKTQDPLYLHIVHTVCEESPSETSVASEEEAKKPTRLAIGGEGGFDGGVKKVKIDKALDVVSMPELASVPWPCDDLPEKIRASVEAVMSSCTASEREAISAWSARERLNSKHSEHLEQLNNGVKIPPCGWKCVVCGLTNNLWMNLTDGSILCGRKYFDGSGGNNHAVEHYEKTKYPLAVKLGTITPDGADVFSYDEDDMVIDPLLAQHLAHFGIDIALMTKTDTTMTEMEIDMNMRIGEWSIIQESGKELVPCYGPGYTGMDNLGNSCYLNSIMQVLFSLPLFQKRYYDTAKETMEKAPVNPAYDFNAQISKLAIGLLSGDYSKRPETPPDGSEDARPKEQKGIRPSMFKAIIGKDHHEFSSMRQQDAQEFFLHLLATIDKNQPMPEDPDTTKNPVDWFRFQFEDRVECVESGMVRYTKRADYLLQLPVPMEMATNKDDVRLWEEKKAKLEAEKKRVNPDDTVRAKVPFQICLEAFAQPQEVEDFYSSALKKKSQAKTTLRFSTFPDYLMVQMAKFSFTKDWVPKKYDVLIDVPETLDLSHLRGKGIQPGEKLLPEEDAPDKAEKVPEVQINEETVQQLVSMGFDREGCKKAVFNTHNSGVEPAMNWVLEHMGDPDFSAPFVSGAMPSEEAVTSVCSLGFTKEQALKALKATNNSVELAVEWMFNHPDEMAGGGVEPSEPMEEDKPKSPEHVFNDGNGKYELIAFVSHMGTSTMCGHYVCHILKDGQWILYNDNKVAISKAPPKDLGYLYLYQRVSDEAT